MLPDRIAAVLTVAMMALFATAPSLSIAKASDAKPSRCKAELGRTAKAVKEVEKSQRALRVSRGGAVRDRMATTVAIARVKKSRERLRRQRTRSNLACGIRIKLKLAKGSVKAPASAIASVVGSPANRQTVVLKRGVKRPTIGEVFIVDATIAGPGILGRVVASRRLDGGKTQLTLKPATLDEAYRTFDLRFDGSLAALTGSPVVTADEGAAASASGSVNKLKAFSCKGPQIKKPDIAVDLTPLQVNTEIDVQRQRVHFLISGRPVLRLRFELKAGASCKISDDVKVFIPVAGPVGIDLAPVLEISTGADSKLDFAMEPRIAVGFEHGTSSSKEFHVFNPMGGPSVSLQGSLGVNAFAGGSIAVSVGGRVGIRGKFGPTFAARAAGSLGQICGDVSGALRVGLDVYANVFIANLSFQLAKGEFLHRALFSECVGNGTDWGSPSTPDPGTGSNPGPSEPEPERAFESVSAGGVHSCGVRGDSTIVCWGNDEQGQATPLGGPFESVSAGDRHTCGVQIDASIVCWGWNAYGQSTPASGSFNSVSAGGGHTCGVLTGGAVACWGNDDFGQSTPPDGTFESVSAGGDHTCGLQADTTLACWGSDDVGQSTPPAGAFKSVGAGNDYTCGVRADGSLACWGHDINETGRIDPPIGAFSTISVGENHACALRGDDTVSCWGGYGEFAAPGGAFKSVSSGGSHTCGLRDDGSIACWGDNTFGQITPPN